MPVEKEAFSADFMRRLKEYDAAAWRQAFDVLLPIALRGTAQASAYLSQQDREEVANDALVELARQIDQFAAWPEVTALAYLAAQRRAVDRFRRLRAQKRQGSATAHVPLEDAAVHELAGDAPAPVQWGEIAGVVEALVEGLGEPAASLVRGYARDGLSYEQLSRRANLPLGTVAAIIYRGMRRLERELGGSSKLGRELSLYL